MLKSEFAVGQAWFKHLEVWIDLSYLGFEKDYQAKKIHIPIKKPYKTKNNPKPKLTLEQKEHNKTVSKTRVNVENAIGGIKRYAILQNKFRNKLASLRDLSIFAAAGLWNFFKGFSFS